MASYLPATRYGGPIESVHGLARAQAELGADVSVLTTSVDGPMDSDVVHEQPVDVDGVKVWYFRSRLLRRLYFSWRMRSWLKRELRRFDVVHVHAVFLFPSTMAARLCNAAGVPYAIAPRGMLVKALIDSKSRWLKRAWIALFERRTLAQAAFIHATSRAEIQEIDRLGLMLAPAQVLMNGVGSRIFKLDALELPEITRPYLLYLGRVTPKKNIDLLVGAIARIAELDLVVIGVDELQTRAKLQTQADALGIAARVHFLGERLGEEKWRWIKHARALALVSVNENFGNSVAEAMLAGIPVIVSQGVGLAQWVGAERAGWVCAPEIETLVAALQELIADPARATTFGQNGQHFAQRTLSWDAIAGKSLQLYRNICGKESL